MPHLPPGQVIRFAGQRGRHTSLVLLPGGALGPRLEGGAVGNTVEPTGHRLPLPDRPGLAREDKKGGLESVLGVLETAQNPAADAEDQRAMPAHQGRKGRRLAPG